MATAIEQELCTNKRVLVELKVVVEPTHWATLGWPNDLEKQARHMEAWAKELTEFFRDHRSQDVNSVTVDRTYEVQCNRCGHEWDTELYEEDGKYHCTGCGRTMETAS